MEMNSPAGFSLDPIQLKEGSLGLASTWLLGEKRRKLFQLSALAGREGKEKLCNANLLGRTLFSSLVGRFSLSSKHKLAGSKNCLLSLSLDSRL